MKRRWLALIALFNFAGVCYAVANQMVTVAILDPERIPFEINDVRSIKMAIGRAESHGIEMMRSMQLGSAMVLTGLLLANFLLLTIITIRAQKTVE